MDEPILTYWIDLNNCIIRIEGEFSNFSTEEMPFSLSKDTWQGSNLLSLIEGDDSKMFYEVLLQRVRILQKPYEFTYRCDSPGIARFMRMRLSPESGNLVRFENFLENESNSLPRIRFYQGDVHSTKRCSICNRLKSGHQWVDLMDENIFYKDTLTSWAVDYTICPDCMNKLPLTRKIY
ncbi:MAG: hypothetical protein ACLFM1_03765 [Bacteroidales bacterium]